MYTHTHKPPSVLPTALLYIHWFSVTVANLISDDEHSLPGLVPVPVILYAVQGELG